MINAISGLASSAYYTVETVCSKTTAVATALFKAITSNKVKICAALGLAAGLYTVSVILSFTADSVYRRKVIFPCCDDNFFKNVMVVIENFVTPKQFGEPISLKGRWILGNDEHESYTTVFVENKGCRLELHELVFPVLDDPSVPAVRQFAQQCFIDEDRFPDLHLLYRRSCLFNNTALVEKLYKENIRLHLHLINSIFDL